MIKTCLRNYQKIITRALVLLTLLIVMSQSKPVSADAAPPPPANGSDLSPSINATNVRMVSERVLIDVVGFSTYPSEQAYVTAQFTMRNLGVETEQMKVRFPLNHSEFDLEYELVNREEYCGLATPFPSIEEISVWVDDAKVKTSITSIDTFNTFTYRDVTLPCWAYFDVTFPPNQDVYIKVSYLVSGYLRDENIGYVEFAYVLGTGAGWKDTIGQADIIVRMPYEINELNYLHCYPDDCVISSTEISWHYENFEPSENIEFAVIRPSIWYRVLTEEEHLEKNPTDGEAWGRLGKAYKDAIVHKRGYFIYESPGAELFQLSKGAYQKAISLLPNDADWHYGYAELLCQYAQWHENTIENWIACIEQVKNSLDINPTHEKANELIREIDELYRIDWIESKFVDLSGPQPNYLILTPQPTNTVTEIPATVQPTSTKTETKKTNTPIPTATALVTITSASEISFTAQTKGTVLPTKLATPSDSIPNQSYSKFVVLLGVMFIISIFVVVVVKWRK